MHSMNKIDENISKIAQLFPNCVTEAKGENGEITHKIDFDMLKQELSSTLVEGREERYQFTWPDKKQAILTANAPINKTLRPCREESVNFDETENLYIEGDNLEVLKLLQETYLGKIKMIYIDPPYNTGNDFVYNDDFSQDADAYMSNSGQTDEDGNRLVANTESNGRFHTDWLNMIYPRLKLAKDLLSDDGVIFISIDDNEVENLKKVCNEIYGEENLIECLIWKKRATPPNDKNIGRIHEFILCYAKNITAVTLGLLPRDEKSINRYSNPDNDARGPWVASDLSANGKGGRIVQSCIYPIHNPFNNKDYYPSEGRCWLFNKEKMDSWIKEGRVAFRENTGAPFLKRYLSEVRQGLTLPTIMTEFGFSQTSAAEGDKLFQKKGVFEYAKPTTLINPLIRIGCPEKDGIILDFFSGSSTTAHAIFQLNAELVENRKFIMVQIPELCDDKSEAKKAGYSNICEIAKERIRRAGNLVKDEYGLTAQNLDIGFRVLKCDTSNMEDVYYSPDHLDKQDLFKNNIKSDRTAEDLLFQVMLDLGIMLSSKIQTKQIDGKTVYYVEGNYLVSCFDEDVTEETITEIAKEKPYYFVMRDPANSKDGDSLITNFEQIFTTYSPETVRKIL